VKRLAHLFGVVVACAALTYFVAHAYRSLAGQELDDLLQPRVIAAGGLLVVLYMALTPLTAIAWAWWLRTLAAPTRFSTAWAILAVTQFGKYLPGNVVHHLGRVALARAHGFGTGTTVVSMALESLVLLVAGVHVGALTFLWDPPTGFAEWSVGQYRGPIIVFMSGVALALVLWAPRIARSIARSRPDGRTLPAGIPIRPGWFTTSACYVLYVSNFVLVGLGLWVVAASLAPTTITAGDLVLLTGGFAASWVFGFLTPGAPAGLGTREAILSLWLSVALGPTVAVTLIVILRIVTTMGDLLSFLCGSLFLSLKTRRASSNTPDYGVRDSSAPEI
jgi:hypothetical protein